jgi:Tol biopolymer transport system component
MHRSRAVFTFAFRLGLGLVVLMSALALLVKGIAQNYPSLSIVYVYHDHIAIRDVKRGVELELGGDYAISSAFATFTPVMSPDNQWIAAANGRDGVLLFDLAHRTRTTLRLDFAQPIWSPDSHYVATIPLLGEKGVNIQSNAEWMTIQLADVQSGEVRQIVPSYQYLQIQAMGWSADSQRITLVAMTTPTPNYTFYRVNRDGSDFHQLDCTVSSGGTRNVTNFMFTADGERVVFASPADGAYHVYVLDLDDCVQTRISDGDRYDDVPRWSPDGKHIAFLSGRDGQQDVYVMDADESHVSRLTDSNENEIILSWSPDSQRLLFISYAAPGGVSIFYYADLRDNRLHPFDLHHGYIESFPTWGP